MQAKPFRLPKKYNHELPMLDALLQRAKLWDPKAPLGGRLRKMKEVQRAMQQEHDFLLMREHRDDFHACILLGGLNLIRGLLDE